MARRGNLEGRRPPEQLTCTLKVFTPARKVRAYFPSRPESPQLGWFTPQLLTVLIRPRRLIRRRGRRGTAVDLVEVAVKHLHRKR